MFKLPDKITQRVGLKMGSFVILAITSILIVSGVIEYSISSANLKNELQFTRDLVAQRLVYNLAMPLWNADSDGVMTVIKAEMKISEISGIKLQDPNTKEQVGLSKQDDGSLQTAVPIESPGDISDVHEVQKDGKTIGTLTVIFNQHILQQKLRSLVVKNIVTLIMLDLLIAIILIWSIRTMFLKPLTAIHDSTKHILSGDLSQKLTITSRDEFSAIGSSFNILIDFLVSKTNLAQSIAHGDLTRRLDIASDRDTLGKALQEMSIVLNQVIGEIRNAAEQVDSQSVLVSSASISLSEGVSQAVASVQQISSRLIEFAHKIETTSQNATETAVLAVGMSNITNESTAKIHEMAQAIQEISNLSAQIAKIIKTIDSIAFQTNLLALNASVEAARAGSHGKGFAVVADEVRNLASRSAIAAQDTTELIEKTVSAINKGTSKITATTAALMDLVTRSEKIGQLVADIAKDGQEQREGILQIMPGIVTIENITQKTMVNSEETASCAQTLHDQSQKLHEIMERFKLEAASA